MQKKEIMQILKDEGFYLHPRSLQRWAEVDAITGPLYNGPNKVIYPRITLYEAYAAAKLVKSKKVRNRWTLKKIREQAQLFQEDETPTYQHRKNKNGEWEIILTIAPDKLSLEQLFAHIWLLAISEAKDKFEAMPKKTKKGKRNENQSNSQRLVGNKR
ncbi:MAG: hypothetical protein P9M03_05810 [Candidatus Theseobacter exili]|nr:hypothetical protein [Candidatus Theseobacter exili]